MADLHDEKTERAILGLILVDNAGIVRARARLRPDSFHFPAHQRIFAAALAVHGNGKPVDHLTLSDELKRTGYLGSVGGPAFLMALDSEAPFATGSSLDSYADILVDLAGRRAADRLALHLSACVRDLKQPFHETRSKALAALAKVSGGEQKFRTLADIGNEVLQQIHNVEEGRTSPVCSTGMRALDEVIGGVQPELIAVGARTGVGKSAFAATLVQNLARAGVRVGVFSLEDAGEWLAWRFLAYETGVNQFVLRYRKKSDEQWGRIASAAGSFAAYGHNILVDDRSHLSSAQLCQAADDMVVNHGCRVILVDHLSEMYHRAHHAERYDLAIEQSLQDIRALQKRHTIPVVLMCQFVEDRETKPDAIPTLADFANAKVVGKMARVVLALTRAPDSDEMRVAVLKQTNGRPGVQVTLKFLGAAAMIRDEDQARGKLLQLPLPDVGEE